MIFIVVIKKIMYVEDNMLKNRFQNKHQCLLYGLSQNPTRIIPLGFVGAKMWIWKQFQDGMLSDTFVFC